MEQRYRFNEGYTYPEGEAENRKNERKLILWLVSFLLAAVIVGFLVGRATASELPTFPVYKVGETYDNVYISACLDPATAKNIALLQQSEGIEAARAMFLSSHVCFADFVQFVPVAIIATFPMLTPENQPYLVSVMEIRSARDPTAPHLYVITEGTLSDDPDT